LKLKESDTCANGGLLNDDILIKTKWFLTNVSIVVYWMMIVFNKLGQMLCIKFKHILFAN
jgi:hypothetical protein